MENNGETGDDQGSGWFEVRKKHRTGSKFSIQNLVGGFSSKPPSNSLRSRSFPNEKSGNSQANKKSQPSKAGAGLASHYQVGHENSFLVAEEAEKAGKCVAKHRVDQDLEHSNSPPVRPIRPVSVAGLKSGTDCVNEVTQEEKVDMVPKIRWGDLEDDALVLHCHNADRTKIKFGDIGDDTIVVYRKAANSNDSLPCVPSCTESQEEKGVVTPVCSSHAPDQLDLMVSRDESAEENHKEVVEISSNGMGRADLVENSEEINNDTFGLISNDSANVLRLNNPASQNRAVEEFPTPTAVQGPKDKSYEGALDISKVPVASEISSGDLGDQVSPSPPIQTISPEAPGDVLVTAAAEDCSSSECGTLTEDLPKVETMTALEEGESGESKERFRERLWCFLFENLNRAIDELYLLCELECDLEQMKEAILVLEEAASDFNELNSRVEGFESVKRSSPMGSMQVNMKTDHRRPHALSWEVRRMTSSPHRAEILSSSLDAFKKIQQERASICPALDAKGLGIGYEDSDHVSADDARKSSHRNDAIVSGKESLRKSKKQNTVLDLGQGILNGEKRNIMEVGRSNKAYSEKNCRMPLQRSSTPDEASQMSLKDGTAASLSGKSRGEHLGAALGMEKPVPKKDKLSTESKVEKNSKSVDSIKRQIALPDKEKAKEKRNAACWKSMDAWKERRNWDDILASPLRSYSRVSHSPGMSRKSVERARVLRDKLMSPEKKKKTALDLKKEAEEKHTRAMRIRSELENERVQRLQRTSEKLNRVNEWQAVRSMKLREGMYARHQRSESRHEAYLAEVVRRAGDESSKVNEVRFITSLNEENKKLMLRQKLQDSELRRAEKLLVVKSKQKEDMAREEAVLERRKLLEAEKLQRLAETQRKKEEAQIRREEERKASSAAREAKAIEQQRRKESRAKAQQEEAELLAQKLAERLSESEQRRKFYLEQIRERASMDFRDQSLPLHRRSVNKEVQGRFTSTNNDEDYQVNSISGVGGPAPGTGNAALQPSLKRRIKKIRQRLMALKFELPEPPLGAESAGIGYRTVLGTARAKIGRWLQELQRLRQARKEGTASIGLIVGEMIKFLEGKEIELHASRQAGFLDFIASALPASHTSKPETCQVTVYFLRLLRVVLSIPANRSYFLAQNLLPPIIPMLSAALENYIKIAASLNVPGSTNLSTSKMSMENFESISEVLEGYLWTVAMIIGHISTDERQLQMQDGLLELVISYQVIHHLRDLFALYDRPQIEGSPFPSSILLSLNLLAVLTSKPRTISSINWESFPSKIVSVNETQGDNFAELDDLSISSVNTSSEDKRSLLIVPSVSKDIPLSNVVEGKPLDESCKINKVDKSVSSARDPDITIELNDVNSVVEMHVTDVSIESQKSLCEGSNKSLPPKVEKSSMDFGDEQKNENIQSSKPPVAFLLSAVAETGLVSLLSLLTAVLLQANNRLSSEQASYVLPSNFEEVATGVLKVLNNLMLLDITLMQRMLARPDLKMEFFHLMSFLLTHCTSKWKIATDQVGLLLLESLLLLAYFALFHRGNQAVLRWGKSPTILHKVCDLPFVFFSDPELMPILAGTLVAACYGCEQNKDVVQQELSTDMLLSLLRSCKNASPTKSDSSPPDNSLMDDSCERNQSGPEPRKLQVDGPVRSSRSNLRSTRVSSGKGNVVGNFTRIGKVKNQKDAKPMKKFEEWPPKHNLQASEPSSTLLLHNRFPSSFIDRAEEFFSEGIPNMQDDE
ncbi:S phase cyclin A-associated protein in the endoplasmic reticulum-like isoform X2 [Macadamia integrifolia]|uniref:S phase cyclin A-associated protein in the endoplasmic reticulum-like isoform X2 n=1 Tax=Macadamia integrifolia TaxID=60698 RepID=UPI001C4F6985|nr:S phase cyclin A-associated protein in the endoplasmic reticulum-like isoform X2 [Macadamia integrifolia]